jgi:hypothetical protein
MHMGYDKINRFIQRKRKIGILESAAGIECICVATLMFYRCFFGTALVDEAYYVSDALAMMHGNLPYVYNWFVGCGMDFLLIPFLFVYECLVPDLAGVLLFSRICFVAFRLAIIFFSFVLTKKHLNKVHALLLIGVSVPFYGGVIQNFSYNTIPVWMGFFTGLLLWSTSDKGGKNGIKYFAAGFCSAIAVLAHPIYLVNVFLFSVLIVTYSKKISMLLQYILGGVFELLVVFIPIVMQSGINKLLYGITYILNSHIDKGNSLVKNTPASRITDAFHAFYLFWLVELMIFVLVYVLEEKIYYIHTKQKLEKDSRIVLASVCAVAGGVFAVMVLNDFDLNAYCSLGAVGFFGVLLFFRSAGKQRGFVYVGLPPVLFAWFEVIFTGSNSAQIRFYSCVLCYFAILWICFLNHRKLVHYAAAGLSIMMVILQCYIDFNYIYRDDVFENLNYRVESGVYKGIYTTADRARDLPVLEAYLNETVKEEETIAFRDNAPCAYLMKNHNICDVWTWDTLQYERNNKSPYKMYSYYKARDMIPDKIIYIDYGRMDRLSIDDADFPYNEFVEQYYSLTEEKQLNATFRVKVYVNDDTFDGDYDGWINQFK